MLPRTRTSIHSVARGEGLPWSLNLAGLRGCKQNARRGGKVSRPMGTPKTHGGKLTHSYVACCRTV